MKAVRMVSLAVVAVGFAVGCSSSTTNPQDVTIADLVGDWTASKFEFTNQANTAQKFDVVQNGGTFDVSVAANGTISGSYDFIFDQGQLAGSITVGGGVVTIINTGAQPPDTLSFTNFDLTGNTFTLTSTDQEIPLVAFSLNPADANTDVPASLAVILTR